jgi:8-oxo-dGTP pyrophosphatase MutT (NUDIX family)
MVDGQSKEPEQDEMLDEIDAFNHVVGKIGKLESYKRKISHRVVHVMVLRGDKIFLARRAMKVRYLPGFYCSSAGGHVQAGEDVKLAALRELEEEIGLQGPIDHLEGFFFEHEFRIHIDLFIKRFDETVDQVKVNPEEVVSGQFYSLTEIAGMDRELFHPQLAPCLSKTATYIRGQR